MATDVEEQQFRYAGIALMAVSMIMGNMIGFIISGRMLESFILGIICLLLAMFFLAICDETNGEEPQNQTKFWDR